MKMTVAEVIICEQGSFCCDLYKELRISEKNSLLEEILKLFVDTVNDIDHITVTRCRGNDPELDLLPTLSSELILKEQRDLLLQTFNKQQVADTEKQFKQLQKLQYKDIMLFKNLSQNEESYDFYGAWKALQRRFDILHKFVGGFASTFANTAT